MIFCPIETRYVLLAVAERPIALVYDTNYTALSFETHQPSDVRRVSTRATRPRLSKALDPTVPQNFMHANLKQTSVLILKLSAIER